MGKVKNVRQLVEKAVMDSIEFSTRNKGQIFVQYSPHVDAVLFHAYKNGWSMDNPNAPTDFNFTIYIKGNLKPTIREAKAALKSVYDFIKEGGDK
ncbi:hypothetical protein [Bacteroides ihuae]|uniref:hypothetical protein n=1 Tax=Bacteroides ihuae TaxID=1852362 RepID=UPI0008DB1393|nr:hypothetical protein [Bacteroides ihuae]MBP1614731.1 hypothetical protein [Bacteroidota bacterium]